MKEYSLNEKTTVPLAWMAAAIPFIVGGIFWLSVMYTNEQADAKSISRLDLRVDAQYALLLEIRDRIIRVEQYQKDSEKRDRKRTN